MVCEIYLELHAPNGSCQVLQVMFQFVDHVKLPSLHYLKRCPLNSLVIKQINWF